MHMFASLMVRMPALRAKDHPAGGSYIGKRRVLGVNVQGLAVLATWQLGFKSHLTSQLLVHDQSCQAILCDKVMVGWRGA